MKHRTFVFIGIAIFAVAATILISRQQPKTPLVPDFQSFAAGAERKQAFFDYFTPIVNTINGEILADRTALLAWRERKNDLSNHEIKRIQTLANQYKLEDFDVSQEADWMALIQRVDMIPPSLVLAQAANESAWGISRFAREGNNYFGQWCFSKGCGLVPKQRTEGEIHEVAAFGNPQASVESYINNLNTHAAYQGLREIRATLREQDKIVSGVALANGLGRYSERGQDYIDELQAMIRHNQLDRLDPPASSSTN
ncbi:glucosaminidase domain-containing protein [Salinivibrio socompensis]|uniref:glucosaminidase domain-containing protein n=1 Tax=Salinivibrio socompensis TaxID=1510206 RepID=UPI000472C3FC|nr:glucosaminidase domain-containing protein [Salinivibrio socompensis]